MTVEFASRLPLSRNELDRDAEFRSTPDLDRVLREDPATRYLPVHGSEMLRTPTAPCASSPRPRSRPEP